MWEAWCVCESVSVSLYACLTRQPASLLRSPLRGDVQSGPMRGLHVNLHVCTCIGSLGLWREVIGISTTRVLFVAVFFEFLSYLHVDPQFYNMHVVCLNVFFLKSLRWRFTSLLSLRVPPFRLGKLAAHEGVRRIVHSGWAVNFWFVRLVSFFFELRCEST